MEVTDNELLRAEPPGATPLDADDLAGLIPRHISTRAELNAWEQENVLHALDRLRKRRPREVLDDAFLRRLHGWMFGDTWSWAGTYRQRETNIGVDPARIAASVRQLCDNYRYQRDAGEFGATELALRFHRDLVWIHPFPNGNGRHSRLAADLLSESLGGKPFSWGGAAELESPGAKRDEYLAALRKADRGDFDPLIAFGMSS